MRLILQKSLRNFNNPTKLFAWYLSIFVNEVPIHLVSHLLLWTKIYLRAKLEDLTRTEVRKFQRSWIGTLIESYQHSVLAHVF